jgi:hypothetical protein
MPACAGHDDRGNFLAVARVARPFLRASSTRERGAAPAEFGKLIAEDAEKWGKVVKFAGLKAE